MSGSAELLNVIRGIVGEMISQQGVARHARVTSVDPVRALVKVSYDEGGTTSGWLPVVQMAAGGGWSSVTLPEPGTQVYVGTDMGHMDHGVVIGAVHSTAQPPGGATPYGSDQAQPLVPGETTFRHRSGASLRLTNGAVEINGTLRVNGDVMVRGQIRDLNGVHGSLDDLRQAYNAHRHPDAQGGTVGPTDHPIR